MELKTFFEENDRCALAFSGGTDSSFLLWAAMRYGADVTAYYINTAFQPQFELDDAERLAKEIGAKLKVIELDVLSDPDVRANRADRCYHCKKRIFSAIMEAAKADGYSLIIDGTNASDDAGDRPGMKALAEMKVRSPLRECGLTKSEIRRLSKEAGLFTWNKPAYACLATRIPTGREIEASLLTRTEDAESFMASLGFTDFRIRLLGDSAKLQIREEQLLLLAEKRTELLERLKKDYDSVLLDLEVRK